MAPLVREDRIVILTTGARTTRAGHGIHELFQRPSVQVATRVGVRRTADAVAGTSNDEGGVANGDGEVASAKKPEYIVGAALDAMLARHEPVEVVYPIRGGRVRDWDALLAVWRHVLLQLLYLRTSQNDCPLLVSLPSTLTRDELAHATRILFETFNVPSLSIAEEPLLSAYAAGSLTATVVDVGWEHCTVTPVMESIGVLPTAVQRSDVGVRHVALYLAHLLSKDESVVQALIQLDAVRSARSETDATNVEQRRASTHEDAGVTLAVRLFELAVQLISEGKVRAAEHEEETNNRAGRRRNTTSRQDEAEFDVAAALVAGREKAAIEEQERKNRAALQASQQEAEGEAVDEAGDVAAAATATATATTTASSKDTAQAGATEEEGAQTILFQGLRIRVAPDALTQATEPLWDPSVLLSMRDTLAQSSSSSLGALDLGTAATPSPTDNYRAMRSLPETIAASVNSIVDVDRRPQLWETLLATGAPVRLISNFKEALLSASQAHLASNADDAPGTTAPYSVAGGAAGGSGVGSALASAGPTSRDSPGMGGDVEGGAQPTTARCIKTPDYFAEYKDRTDLAPFLGATIYAKLAFTDPYGRLVTTKAVYNEKGPSASFLISAPS